MHSLSVILFCEFRWNHDQIYWLIDWLTDWMNDPLYWNDLITDWPTTVYWLTDWLSGWLAASPIDWLFQLQYALRYPKVNGPQKQPLEKAAEVECTKGCCILNLQYMTYCCSEHFHLFWDSFKSVFSVGTCLNEGNNTCKCVILFVYTLIRIRYWLWEIQCQY